MGGLSGVRVSGWMRDASMKDRWRCMERSVEFGRRVACFFGISKLGTEDVPFSVFSCIWLAISGFVRFCNAHSLQFMCVALFVPLINPRFAFQLPKT